MSWICGKCESERVRGFDDGQITDHFRTCPKRQEKHDFNSCPKLPGECVECEEEREANNVMDR